MPNTKAPTGQRFGRLTIIDEAGRTPDSRALWLCRCDCGIEKALRASYVRRGHTKSCGCGTVSNRHDLSGQRFGLLRVIAEAGRASGQRVTWRCICDCGGEREVVGGYLVSGQVVSCGCRNRNRKHGLYGTPLYDRWRAMIQRTTNPRNKRYADYGGRGIRVCREWRESFQAFARDVGPGFSSELQLDRIDVNGNYEPGNVRWVTRSENERNKRTTRHLTFQGRTHTVAEWAELLDLKAGTIRFRLNKAKWPVERALTESVDPRTLAALKKENNH